MVHAVARTAVPNLFIELSMQLLYNFSCEGCVKTPGQVAGRVVERPDTLHLANSKV
jgi:hypothetical protein